MATLWEGKVKIKKSLVPSSAYLTMTEDSFVFKKNVKSDSKIILEVKKSEIRGINAPKYGLKQKLLTGYTGLEVVYQDSNSDKEKKVIFWPPGFGAWPNSKELPKLITQINSTYKLKIPTDSTGYTSIILEIVAVFSGWFLGGLIGVVTFPIALSLSSDVYKKKDYKTTEKVFFIGIIWAITIVLNIIIQILLFKQIWVFKSHLFY